MKVGLYDLFINEKIRLPEIKMVQELNCSLDEELSTNDIVDVLNDNLSFCDMKNEHSYIACTTLNDNLIGIGVLGIGNGMEVTIDIKTIASFFLLMGADQFSIFHNHPNGTCEPSEEDEQHCAVCNSAAMIFDIKMKDYVIVSKDGWYGLISKQCNYD